MEIGINTTLTHAVWTETLVRDLMAFLITVGIDLHLVKQRVHQTGVITDLVSHMLLLLLREIQVLPAHHLSQLHHRLQRVADLIDQRLDKMRLQLI